MAAVRAAVLLPISAIASADGPMNVRPASCAGTAKSAFSARKPAARMDGIGAGGARSRDDAAMFR